MKRIMCLCVSALVAFTGILGVDPGPVSAELLKSHAFSELDLSAEDHVETVAVHSYRAGSRLLVIQRANALTLVKVVDVERSRLLRTVELAVSSNDFGGSALSGNGQVLYVGGADHLYRYSASDLQLLGSVPYPTGPRGGAPMTSVSSRPDTLLVTTTERVVMFVSGVEQPDVLPLARVSDIWVSDVVPGRVVMYSALEDPLHLVLATMTATGFSGGVEVPTTSRLETIEGANGTLYDRLGQVVNAETGVALGDLDVLEGSQGLGWISHRVDGARHRAYYAVGRADSTTVSVHNTSTAETIDRFVLPAGDLGPGGMTVVSGRYDAAITTATTMYLVQFELEYGSFGELTALSPQRILDTRDGTGRHGVAAPIGHGQQIDVQITGFAGVPATGVDSVVLNATVTQPSMAGYISIFPTGIERPLISNLNFTPGQTVANLVTVSVGAFGRISLYNLSGNTHVIFDIAGYNSSETGPSGSRFHPVTPARIIDTRDTNTPLSDQRTMQLDVTGPHGVPNTGVTAIALNVTAVDPTAAGFLTVWPDGDPHPTASNLNFLPGQNVPNLVFVKTPKSGRINIFNPAGITHVIVDVIGYFDHNKIGNTGRMWTLDEPFRRLDTREDSPFPPPGAVWPQNGIIFPAPDNPTDEATAVIMNVTVTEPTEAGYITVYPGNGEPPLASNLNFVAGQTVANLVIVPAQNDITLYNSNGDTHLIADIFAIYT